MSAFLVVLLVTLMAHGQEQNPNVAATPPLSPKEQLKKFHLPPGFVIELVAAEPKIKKPINIAFDALGRLWVTESVEYPYAAPSGRAGKDTVKIVSGFAPNGLAQAIATFADGLNIPIGVLPDAGAASAVVYSIPSIYRVSDTDGDGKADKREVLYGAYGHADTHGMTGEFMRGFDGWIYCCHGFSNTSQVKGHGDTAITMQSGNTYRIKPDGSRIEYVTHGQVNPFGLTFDPLGNLYSCDCHSRPIYQLLKGAYYPSFGKPHDGLGFGPELLTHDHGSTAIAGITYYAADQFPPEYRDNIFIGNVVTNRINRDRLEKHGSTYKGIEMPDFVKCDDPWFRPVDIKLGPDGVLYVADFYNRIIGHYEVPLSHPGRDHEKGRIWRIVYRGADGQQKPKEFRDLTKVTVTGLIAELDNPNLAVRMQATEQLIARGTSETKESTQHTILEGTPLQRAHGLWVLERLRNLDMQSLRKATSDKEPLVRVHALRILAERATWSPEEHSLAIVGLHDSDPFARRNAAAALGAHPDAANVGPLLKLRHEVPAEDTHLLHVTRMALRDQLRLPGIWKGLANLSEQDSRSVADVCLGVHDAESAEFLQRHLARYTEPLSIMQNQAHYIARFGMEGSGSWVLKWTREKFPKDLNVQGQVLRTVHQATQERGGKMDAADLAMSEDVAVRLLGSKQVGLGIELAGLFKVTKTQGTLLSIVNNAKANKGIRRNAVIALLAIDAKGNTAALANLINSQDEAIEVREQIAGSLASTNSPAAHMALVKALETAPARLQTTIALGLAGSSQGGEKLLEAVAAGKASARLLQETAIGIRLGQAKIADLSNRLARLTKGLPTADQRVQALLGRRRDGYHKAQADPGVGVKVFEKHCAACHQIANKGAKIGPQLDGVGVRGLERLLEDTLDPNRNVDQAFRTTTLVLTSGQLVNGLLLRQDGTILVLADSAGKEVRVPAADVQERLVSPLSPMPGNFAELIPEDDFNHLLAYLLAQRTKK
jgi:putative heme-binding domain-containing protein